MNLDQAKQTFIVEARELLRNMEESLLVLDAEPDDRDTIDALFRAAHTIKGSAGMFDLGPIVTFTHVVENLLSDLRDGKVAPGHDLIAILLSCNDHIDALVERVAEQGADPDLETMKRGDGLIEQLHAFMSPEKKPDVSREPAGMPAPLPAASRAGGHAVRNDNWHLSVRFGRDVLRNGMDPLSFLRYLATLGEVVSMTALFDTMPAAAEMDPESCYLGLEMDFKSGVDKETITNVFEFLREDCRIRILPPHSLVSDYIEMINTLPEDSKRLGELLVSSGALTQEELEEGLQIQRCPAMEPFSTCIYRAQGVCDGQRCSHDRALQCRYETPPEETPSRMRLGEILVEEGMVQREIVDSALEKQKLNRDGKLRDRKFIRVQADKLDALINMVGELVIASASAALLAQRTGDAMLHEATSQVSHLVDEIRGGALQLRMVPIGETFSRFRRAVHDLSRELNKDIELVIGGSETELDKSMIERLTDPLTHMVRNAISHGIEPANHRIAHGKPRKGTVRLNAYHDSGSIVIEVGDDGAGLNRDKILNRAIERGIIDHDRQLSEREIHNLIFEAGFSTAEKVTDLSGRGVGMDVVRRSVEALRGMVEVESREGAGTTVRIRLPLTLAIIDGFLIGVGSASYVVPLDMVVECIELDEKLAATGRSYINLRGEVLPYLQLRDQFREAGESGRRESIVVVQFAGRKAGLVVDKLMGEFQTVIRPLGKIFSNLKGISGTTVLGSGEVALILDVPALVHLAKNGEQSRMMA